MEDNDEGIHLKLGSLVVEALINNNEHVKGKGEISNQKLLIICLVELL